MIRRGLRGEGLGGQTASARQEVPMRLGLHVNRFPAPAGPSSIADALADIARRAEEAGISSLSVMDHFFQLVGLGGPEDHMLEAYTALGYVAARTSRIRL